MVAEAESLIAPLIEDIWLNAMRSPTVRVVTTKQFGTPQLELRAARDIKGGEKLTDIPFLWLEVLDENHLQLVYDADDKCIGPAPVNADMSFGKEVPKTGGGTSAKSWIGCGPARLLNVSPFSHPSHHLRRALTAVAFLRAQSRTLRAGTAGQPKGWTLAGLPVCGALHQGGRTAAVVLWPGVL